MSSTRSSRSSAGSTRTRTSTRRSGGTSRPSRPSSRHATERRSARRRLRMEGRTHRLLSATTVPDDVENEESVGPTLTSWNDGTFFSIESDEGTYDAYLSPTDMARLGAEVIVRSLW